MVMVSTLQIFKEQTTMNFKGSLSQPSFPLGNHKECYSKENLFNLRFQQSYVSDMAYTQYSEYLTCYGQYGEQVMYGEHESYTIYDEPGAHDEHNAKDNNYHDENDSGVNSEDNEEYNDTESKHNACNDYLNNTNKMKPARQNVKPLSAWKAKQMKLSAAGVIKTRRDANNRERKRMNGLNEAFARLREHIPGDTKHTDKKLSKMDTLQMANMYIRHLAALLEKS